MLEGIRIASRNWLGRLVMTVIMGFLILSFAIWGIGDTFRGFGQNRLASVGDSEITTEQFRTAWQNELTRYQRQLRRAVSNEQARAMGLDTQVLSRLITESLMDQEAKRLGLAISDEEIAKAILSDSTFKGPTGQFDRLRFNETIREAGYNEQGFIRAQREHYLRRQIADALVGGVELPQAALIVIDRYRGETRNLETVVFPPSAAGEIPAPSAEELAKFFEARKAAFRAPEYRKATVLALTPATAARPQDVSDADVQKRYEDTKAQRYGAPERRHVLQLVFPNEADAKAAAEKIAGGATFESVAEERKVAAGDYDLGPKARADFFDKSVADAVFTLAENAVSAPVKGDFGHVLVKVNKIEPASFRPFAEVADAIRNDIATERVSRTLQDLRDKIEDLRASGKPLAEAAKDAGLQARFIDAIDATGRDKAGQPVEGIVEPDNVLKAIFASDVGVDNEVLNTMDRGFVWFEIAGVEPARERTLDEVKAKVEAEWRSDEIARRLREKLAEIVKAANGGETLAAIAEKNQLELRPVSGVRRAGGGGLNTGAVAQVFNLKVGEAGSAATDDGGRILFKVMDSVVPPYDSEAGPMKQIADQLRTSVADDILSQFIAKLQADAKVTINQTALRQATGGDRN